MCCDPGERSNIAILTASKSVFGRSSSQYLARVYVDVESSEGQRTREDQVVSREDLDARPHNLSRIGPALIVVLGGILTLGWSLFLLWMLLWLF
jgi:hypothetical protein